MREITDEVKKVIIGKDEVVDMVFAAILAQGHVLMEDVPGVGKTTHVIGSEGHGLTDRTVEACDMAVRIPMTDRVESLNAAVAGSVLLWHFRGV